jgi:hypothetical protein
MLPFLLVLAVFGLLCFLGIRVSMYLYKASTLGTRHRRRSGRSQALPAAPDTDPEIEEAEYYANLLSVYDRVSRHILFLRI